MFAVTAGGNTVATKSDSPKRAFTVAEFCASFSLSRATFYRLVAAGKLKPVHVGRRVLIPAQSIEAWAASLQSAA